MLTYFNDVSFELDVVTFDKHDSINFKKQNNMIDL